MGNHFSSGINFKTFYQTPVFRLCEKGSESFCHYGE